jgi:hypothetical protein
MSSANQRREIRILSLARAPRHSPQATSAFGNRKIGFENGHFAEIRAEIKRSTIGRIRRKTDAIVVVNLNSDDYSDREIDIFSANQIPAF